MNKRRICCFCEKWASGGIESFMTNVLTHMDLSELSVDVVAVKIERSVFTQRLENIGIQFYELSGDRKRIVKNGNLFCGLIKKREYDVIHVNAFHGGSLSGSFGWDDVGSWLAVGRIRKSNEFGNVISGNAVTVDTKECIIQGEEKLIATVGLEDVIVVDTRDALLICHKDHAGDIKKVLENLKICNRTEYL